MELYKFVFLGSPDAYLTKQLAMNSSERKEFKRNLKTIASEMNQRCHAGKLQTDLNLKSFFRGERQNTDCGPKLGQIAISPAKPLAAGELMAQKQYNVRTEQIFNEAVVDGKRKLSELSKLGAVTTVGDVLKPIEEFQLNQYTIVKAVVIASKGGLKSHIGKTVYVSKGVFSK